VCGDLKGHAISYFIPITAVALRRSWSRKQLAVAAITAIVTLLAPFALGNVSLATYVRLLAVTAGPGWFLPQNYATLLGWGVALATPICAFCVLALWRDHAAAIERFKTQRYLLLCTGVGFLGFLFPASRIGSGPHHVLPYIAVVLFLAVELVRSGVSVAWQRSIGGVVVNALAYSWLICVFGVGLWDARDLWWQTQPAQQKKGDDVIADLERLQATYGSRYTLVMGAGGDPGYPLTRYRPELAFKGSPIGIDPVALMDSKWAGVPPPDLNRFLDSLRNGPGPPKPVMWLIPKGDGPFSMSTWYKRPGNPWADDPLYEPDFKEQFARRFSALAGAPSVYFTLYVESRPQ
jgi:hypothetical protein